MHRLFMCWLQLTICHFRIVVEVAALADPASCKI